MAKERDRAGRVELLTGIDGVTTGPARHGCGAAVPQRLHSGLGGRFPTIARRLGGRRDWDRGSQTGRRRSAGHGDLSMTAELLSNP
jgi:hypothetical protein